MTIFLNKFYKLNNMKTMYDSIPPKVVREGKIVRIFFDFVPVEIQVANNDEDTSLSETKTITKFEGININLTGTIDYDKLVDSIISEKYPTSNQFAIIMNKQKAQTDPDADKSAEYLSDYDELEAYTDHSKEVAKELLTAIESL